MHYNSSFGNLDHGLHESVVAIGPAYTQNIMSIFFIEHRVAASLAPPNKKDQLLIRLESCTTNRGSAQRCRNTPFVTRLSAARPCGFRRSMDYRDHCTVVTVIEDLPKRDFEKC